MPTSSASGAVRRAIDAYFAGERRDALLFTLLGAANIGASVAVLLAVPDQRLLGLALALIGLLEILPGAWALQRQVTRHAAALDRQRGDPDGWRTEEAARLQRVLDVRKRLRIADALFVVAFVFLVIRAPATERMAWLIVPGQMVLLPLLNIAMARRTRRFAEALASS